MTDTSLFIALALEVVPERDLRVEEDHEATFVVFFDTQVPLLRQIRINDSLMSEFGCQTRISEKQ